MDSTAAPKHDDCPKSVNFSDDEVVDHHFEHSPTRPLEQDPSPLVFAPAAIPTNNFS